MEKQIYKELKKENLTKKRYKFLSHVEVVIHDYLVILKQNYTLQKKLDEVIELKSNLEESIKRKDGSELNSQGIFNELERI
ncbi:MAG: hypothetical protein V1815_01470, partial [Candidatus Woesearchaeota archaeon]